MMNASEDLEAMMTAKSEDLSPQRQPPLLQQQQQTPRLGLLDAASHLSSSVLEADSNPAQDDDDWDGSLSSVTSSILDYEFENGRRYHAYKAGHYPLPNDEIELDRLDLQHHVIKLLLNGEIHLAPLDNPRRILDIGTGTGLWAIEMADRYPNATVTGTDLSPVQPTWVPDNVRFEIDDAESEWLYKESHFCFIHSRYMIGAIGDWQSLIRRAYHHTRPNGHFELQELDPRLRSDDASLAKSPMHHLFTRLICEASAKHGKPVPSHSDFAPWFREAGFVDVEERLFKIPSNAWPKNRHLKEVGKFQLINYSEGYEGIGIGLFTRILGWQPSEFQVLLARTRAELRDRAVHTYQTFVVVTGRKPPASQSRQPSPASPLSTNQHLGDGSVARDGSAGPAPSSSSLSSSSAGTAAQGRKSGIDGLLNPADEGSGSV